MELDYSEEIIRTLMMLGATEEDARINLHESEVFEAIVTEATETTHSS